MVEYGLIVGLIAVLVVTMFTMFNALVDLGEDSGGTLSEEGRGRNQAAISAGLY